MKYSFVIPVYNSEKCLDSCVQSILSQNINDFEVLLVDDGSKDSSPALCDRLAQQHSEVRAFHQPNGGVSSARNRGIREATGDYLLFVDSDDVLLPFSDAILQDLENRKPDVLIFGMRFQYSKGDRIVRETDLFFPETKCMDLTAVGENFRELFNANCFSSSCNKIFSRKVLVENNILFDSRLINYEDLDYSLRFISKCSKLSFFSDVCYLYQISAGEDHTVERLARVDDVMGNTDLIANAFFELEASICPGKQNVQLRKALLDIYTIQFWSKIQTVPLCNLNRYCVDFLQNTNIRTCMLCANVSDLNNNPIYKWIEKRAAFNIWAYVRYRKVRNFVVNIVKKVLFLRK